jgi:5,10-methylenetetrahydromethanopterin reductase
VAKAAIISAVPPLMMKTPANPGGLPKEVFDGYQAALAAGRSIAAWFPQTAPHLCRLAGLDAQTVDAVRASYAGGEFQEADAAARLLPDDFVRRMALAGDAGEAAGRVRDVLRAGVDSVHVFPLGADRMATVRAFADVMKTMNPLTGSER